MGATKEYLEMMEKAETTDLTPEQLQESLTELKSETPKENPAYQARESRVFKGRFAPIGSVYLIVTAKREYKGEKQILTSWILLKSDSLSLEDKEEIALGLFEKLKEKYPNPFK